jgi:hypothetical protein
VFVSSELRSRSNGSLTSVSSDAEYDRIVPDPFTKKMIRSIACSSTTDHAKPAGESAPSNQNRFRHHLLASTNPETPTQIPANTALI